MKRRGRLVSADSQGRSVLQLPDWLDRQIGSVSPVSRGFLAIQSCGHPVPPNLNGHRVPLAVFQCDILSPSRIVFDRASANSLQSGQMLAPGVNLEGSLAATGGEDQGDRVFPGSAGERDLKIVFRSRLIRDRNVGGSASCRREVLSRRSPGSRFGMLIWLHERQQIDSLLVGRLK